MFDNANTKSQAWTDSLEVEAGNALAKFMTPVSAGLLHKSHIYQVFARHRLESTLRERDGVFLSVSDKAAFLVSVKARYGAEEEKELLADIGGLQDKFVLSDWFFQTSEKKEKTLLRMPKVPSLLQLRILLLRSLKKQPCLKQKGRLRLSPARYFEAVSSKHLIIVGLVKKSSWYRSHKLSQRIASFNF